MIYLFINTRKLLFILFMLLICGLLIFNIFIDDFVPTAGTQRLIPIYSVEKEEKVIAISFDAAWGAEYTSDTLDILDKYDVKTTYFLVEFWVDKYPDMVKEIYERGHEIGNHSATHPHMTQLSKDQIIKELDTTSKKVENITGEGTKLFRPPFGDYNNTLIATSEELGYNVIQWDVDSLDTKVKQT